MGFIGVQPASVPLTADDITDGIISNAKLGADSVNATKISDDSISDEHLDITSITGQTAITSLADTDKFLVSDASDSGNLKYVENQYLGGGGSWNLVYSDDVSGMGSGSNAYTDSSMFSSTYNFYRVYIIDWEPQNDSIDMNLQLKLGGVTRTSNYKFSLDRNESGGTQTPASDNSGGSIRIMEGCGNGTGENMSGYFEYQNPTGDNGNWYVTVAKYAGVESNQYAIGGMGHGTCVDSTGAMTGFTIKAHSGGLGSYKLRAYGLKQS